MNNPTRVTGLGQLLPWLSGFGRRGAWAAISLGIVAIVVSWYWFGGLIGLILGLFLVGFGFGVLRLPRWDALAGPAPSTGHVGTADAPARPQTWGHQLPLELLRESIPTAPRPGWVCGRCKVLYAPGECRGVCLRCDTSHMLYALDDDDDVSIALAALD